MVDQFYLDDLLKVLLSLIAGLLLGMERELKDKAAGVKTISIICMGAALFSILSQRFDPERATTMAAYIVTGVGFIGAGVIFKDGVNITGLTTASIIWISAAIGASIGFGDYFPAAFFLAGCFLVIGINPLITGILSSKKQSRKLTIRFLRKEYKPDNEVILELNHRCHQMEVQRITQEDEIVELIFEISTEKDQIPGLGNYLLSHPSVISFEL